MTYSLNPNVSNLPANPLRRIFEQARPGMINLASGHPNPVYCDSAGLEAASQLAAKDQSSWRYGASSGDPELIEALSPWLAYADNTSTLITSGAQQGIFLACQALGQSGQTLLVPDPVYPAVLSVAVLLGLDIMPYRVSSVSAALEDVKATTEKQSNLCAIYVLPTFANPNGDTWSLEERDALLDICAAANLPIIEDDPYRELWFQTTPPARLIERAAERGLDLPVLSLGSLSKIVAPGLRVGWVQGPIALVSAMTAARQAADLQPNSLAQRVALHYLLSGSLEPHLAKVRGEYAQAHHDFASELENVGFTRLAVAGGMFVMPHLPETTRLEGLIEHINAEGLLVAPGSAFAIDTSTPSRQLRLCFASLPRQDLAKAGKKLAKAVETWS
jgi:2-aminoadipate transaminase